MGERIVRSICTITNVMFFYICILIIGAIIYPENVNSQGYAVMLVAVFFMQLLMSKLKKNWIAGAAAFFIGAIACYFIYPLEIAIFNLAAVTGILILSVKYEKEDISYNLWKKRIIRSIIALMAIGIITPALGEMMAYWVIKCFIVYLIFSVVAMREIRNYCNRITNKKAQILSIVIILIGVLISTDFGYFIIASVVSYSYKGVAFVIGKVAMVIFAVVYKPLMAVGNGIVSFIYWLGALIFGKDDKEEEMGIPKPEEALEELKGGEAPHVIMFIILGAILALVLFKVIRRVREAQKERKLGETLIEREKIDKPKDKRGKFSLFGKKVFKGDWDVRMQILYIYSKFQIYMRGKNIFKPYMTATQLSNVAKTKNYEEEALDNIKIIYNEAKFSKHQLKKEGLSKIKEEYGRIKTGNVKTTFRTENNTF